MLEYRTFSYLVDVSNADHKNVRHHHFCSESDALEFIRQLHKAHPDYNFDLYRSQHADIEFPEDK